MSAPESASTAGRDARVLKWEFRRRGETLRCELGLTSDSAAYQLRLESTSNPSGVTIELFNDVLSAFQRQARLELRLIAEGWTLENIESQRHEA